MNKINLEKADPKNLTILTNPYDVRKDLHVFACYCHDYEIKRGHRDNSLPKVHLTRLAKMMSNPQLIQEVREDGNIGWIDFIDRLNLNIGFIDYATEGIYTGYTSTTESYPDNYIEFLDNSYDQYLNQSLQEQENQILQVLVDEGDPCLSEFFTGHPLSTLNRFSRFGCATGMVEKINFPKIRSYLLELNANCQAGVWYRTASLIAYLKNHNPFFLISNKIPFKKTEYTKDRYHNFHEAKPDDHYARLRIRENSKDRFERVEGRFVERFLEGKMDKDTAGRFTAVSIGADTHIVRKPQKLFKHLELAQKVPVYVKHSDRAFKSLEDNVKSKYTDKKNAKKTGSRKKRRFTLKCTRPSDSGISG